MNDVECTVRNNPCMLLRKFRREKTLGEIGAAVIKTINNLLRTAWLQTRAPNGDRAGASRCSEEDHAGHICEVPHEEHSPSMYIVQSSVDRKEESQLIDHILQVLLRKLTSEKPQWLYCQCMHELSCNSKVSSCPFPCIMCHVITGVYFSAG